MYPSDKNWIKSATILRDKIYYYCCVGKKQNKIIIKRKATNNKHCN